MVGWVSILWKNGGEQGDELSGLEVWTVGLLFSFSLRAIVVAVRDRYRSRKYLWGLEVEKSVFGCVSEQGRALDSVG